MALHGRLRNGVLLTLLLLLATPSFAAPATTRGAGLAAGELRVMSFNIRNSFSQDGEDAWPLRREMVLATIQAFEPDILGLQETQPDQRDFLQERMNKTHEFIGVGRDDGKNKGEIASVIFRRQRFEKLREGHFWLSQTPDVIGSKGWDAAVVRICTWVELKDRAAGGRSLFVFNTHFDHKGVQAREQSARLLRRQVEQIAAGAPAIVMGDFNARENSPVQKTLLEGDLLSDTFVDTHPGGQTEQDYTFHGFTGKLRGAAAHRIDWILRSDHFATRQAAIDKTRGENGRYPSDHFPVTAVLRWREAVNR